MIKTLIVDDDRLVRLGLITVLPWKKYNMEIIGEASNGEKALTLLKDNDIDLVLIDLSMPGMSGIELMKIAKEEYPDVHMVVLTLHKEFNYIQQAMRLGAIDYITKEQFTKENFDDILARIQNRIESVKSEMVNSYNCDDVYIFVSYEEEVNSNFLLTTAYNIIVKTEEIDEGIWTILLEDQSQTKSFEDRILQSLGKNNAWVVVRITGISGLNKKNVHKTIRKYKKRGMFYELKEKTQFLIKNYQEVLLDKKEANKDAANLIKTELISLKWLGNNIQLDIMLNKLKDLFLPQSKLIYLMHQVLVQWEIIYSHIATVKVVIPEKIIKWYDVDNWFFMIKNTTKQLLRNDSYSEKTSDCIMKAVRIIKNESHKQVHASDIAKRVNLSKSYFSICFKRLMGKSFNLFLRDVRLEKAKEYLVMTDKSISIISEMVGYMDSKYFSRLFYEHTGYLPSKFRIENKHR